MVGWLDGWMDRLLPYPLMHLDTQLFSLLFWSLELSKGQSPEDELRKGRSWGQTDELDPGPCPQELSNSVGKEATIQAEVMRLRATLTYPCRVLQRNSMHLSSGCNAACRGSFAWGWGQEKWTSQAPKPCKPILVHFLCLRHCQASLRSFPRCPGNERPTQVVHSKAQEPERTMPNCSELSSVSLEAFYGPSLGKHDPINALGVPPLLLSVSPPTAAGAGA